MYGLVLMGPELLTYLNMVCPVFFRHIFLGGEKNTDSLFQCEFKSSAGDWLTLPALECVTWTKNDAAKQTDSITAPPVCDKLVVLTSLVIWRVTQILPPGHPIFSSSQEPCLWFQEVSLVGWSVCKSGVPNIVILLHAKTLYLLIQGLYKSSTCIGRK